MPDETFPERLDCGRQTKWCCWETYVRNRTARCGFAKIEKKKSIQEKKGGTKERKKKGIIVVLVGVDWRRGRKRSQDTHRALLSVIVVGVFRLLGFFFVFDLCCFGASASLCFSVCVCLCLRVRLTADAIPFSSLPLAVLLSCGVTRSHLSVSLCLSVSLPFVSVQHNRATKSNYRLVDWLVY